MFESEWTGSRAALWTLARACRARKDAPHGDLVARAPGLLLSERAGMLLSTLVDPRNSRAVVKLDTATIKHLCRASHSNRRSKSWGCASVSSRVWGYLLVRAN